MLILENETKNELFSFIILYNPMSSQFLVYSCYFYTEKLFFGRMPILTSEALYKSVLKKVSYYEIFHLEGLL